MEIRVLDIRLLPGNRVTRAFADISLGEITIRDFRVLQSNGRPYVKAPFQTYKNAAGEIQFKQIIDLPDEVRGQVDTAILGAFYRKRENESDNRESK